MSFRLSFADIADWIVDFRRSVPDQDSISMGQFCGWLANNIDHERFDKQAICGACFIKSPEESEFATSHYDSQVAFAEHVCQCLLSAEFRARVPEVICRAFPSANRVFFVHIPKSGGTGIRDRLIRCRQAPVWDYSFEDHGAIQRQGEAYILVYIGRAREQSDRELFFTGHRPLSRVLNSKLVRNSDLVFAVVRDPLDTILSGINYAFKRSRESWDESERRFWSGVFENCGITPEVRKSDVLEPIGAVIQSQAFTDNYSNLLSRYLGDGSSLALEAIRTNVVRSGIVLVDFPDIDRFMERTFGIYEELYDRNASDRIVGRIKQLPISSQCYVYEKLVGFDLQLREFLRNELSTRWFRVSRGRKRGRVPTGTRNNVRPLQQSGKT